LTVQSQNHVPIRLPDERWVHITDEHSELAGYYFEVLETVQQPDAIYLGNAGELLATREIAPGKHLIVVYKEVGPDDGFIITAFSTSRIDRVQRRTKLWPP
jgi:hypothetical protein